MKPTPAQEARAAQTVRDQQMDFETWIANLPSAARGAACGEDDMPRLNEQGFKVYRFMRDLRPHTLKEIEAATGAPQASASARLREIRRYLEKDGKGTVKRTRVDGGNGLHTYTLRLNKTYGAA